MPPPPRIVRFALLLLAEGLIKVRQRGAARHVMLWLTRRDRSRSPKMLSLVARAWAGQESSGHIAALQFAHLNQLIQKPIKAKDYPRLLYLAARYEAAGKGMPVAAGNLIARQMVSDNGRRRIRDASAEALKQAPESAFLSYLNAVTTAKCGDAASAGLALSDRIKELAAKDSAGSGKPAKIKRSFNVLRAAWRVVDQIARDDMQWLDSDRGKTYSAFATLDPVAAAGDDGIDLTVRFNEPLLQARAADAYLAACRLQFERAKMLSGKLLAIKEMLRQGTRRRLAYYAEYAAASECYDLVRDDLARVHREALAKAFGAQKPKEVVRSFRNALDLCRTLGRWDEAARLVERLAELSPLDDFADERWNIIQAIVDSNDPLSVAIARDLRAEIVTLPQTEGDLKAFLQWAMIAREFDDAEMVFVRMRPGLRASEAALYFVNILQRQARFADAMRLIRNIHAQMLVRPASLKPFIHWNLIRRYGEMGFLQKTAIIYSEAPQPVEPAGVVILAARNVDQLRKYPLIVLVEMKRRGWAVIPLVEGLLPKEATSIPSLDVLNGCVTLDNNLVPAADAELPVVEDFEVDVAKGRLRWREVDLGHSLLEEARVGRRAYNVDLTCPALDANLRRLCRSTALYVRAIDHARATLAEQNRRGALMSLFNSRLPDSLFRSYCDKYGDPEDFFCLHTSNGYENYFRNFQTSISTRCVIRNVTKYDHVRVASMPIPEHFENYFREQKENLDSILAKIEDVANIRRTTGGEDTLHPEAEACRERILAWRANGGKVACLFGRVVCDSAVPYDGGPAHADLSDWLNHTIEAVRGSNTLLVIKPHPHEINETIGTYLNEYFVDLIKTELPDNVLIMGHKWFDIQSLKEFVDLGLIYSSTAAVELALLELPTVVCGHFNPIDYPVGNIVPRNRKHYAKLVRFEAKVSPDPEYKARAAIWLDYMSSSGFVADYRYHSRPITNRVVYPPYWIDEDVRNYIEDGDSQVAVLVERAIGTAAEPGG